MKKTLSVTISVLALALVVLGATQAGEAAVGAVKVALFAKNSGKVNGLQAAKAPKPGRLVPLGANGRFPASVVPAVAAPAGPQGPRGDAGAKGDAGQPGAKGEAGEQGAKGATGDAGQRGAQGQIGVSGYEVVTGTPFTLAPGQTGAGTAACPVAKVVVGGGFSSAAYVGLDSSNPLTYSTGWHVVVRNVDSQPGAVTPYAICTY